MFLRMIPRCLLILFCLLTPVFLLHETSKANEETVVRLTENSVVEFTASDRSKELIGEQDEFVKLTQELERQVRLQTTESVSVERYLKFMQDGVKPWEEGDIEDVSSTIAEIADKVKEFDLPWPKRIFLIRVGSEVEANAPHCRGPSIILPDSFFTNAERMKTVLVHELFHVLSSHNPELRNKLYAIIGFQPCNRIEFPKSLRKRRLTNPDAPTNEHFIRLKTADAATVDVVPVTFVNREEYSSGSLFNYLAFKLMVVEQAGNKWTAKLDSDGQPEMLEPNETPDLMRQIGRNTGYIIHPEETLADNFWMLILEKSDVRDPWVIEKMRAVLLR